MTFIPTRAFSSVSIDFRIPTTLITLSSFSMPPNADPEQLYLLSHEGDAASSIRTTVQSLPDLKPMRPVDFEAGFMSSRIASKTTLN